MFVAALVVRLTALELAMLTGRFPVFWEYEVIARNLLSGVGFVYQSMNTVRWAYVEPVYPFLVAAVYVATGFNTTVLGVVQCIIAALLAPVIYEFGRRTFDSRTGFAAAALIVVDPALAGYAANLHPLTIDALLIALVGLTLLRLVRRPQMSTALVFGIATGVCILSRPTVIAFVISAAMWLVFRRPQRDAVRPFALGLAIAALVIAPWVARNYARLGTFVLTRSHVGFGFWLGNHPGAVGGEGDPSDPSGARSIFEIVPPALQERVMSQTNEIDQDRIFRTEAIRYVDGAPVAFVGRTIRKLYYFWWFPPYFGKLYASWQTASYRVFYLVILGLALLGIVAIRRDPVRGQGDGVFIAILLPAAISVAQAMFYVQGRHRLAVEAMLIVFSGRGLDWTIRRVTHTINADRP